MQPKVTNVREQNSLGANGKITKVIVLTYTVGAYGPFTLTTNAQELSSGAATAAMQNFANTLATLPAAT
ncbi:MAG: hypothetical protein WAN65_20990 [Candidatus Sulfotelmatobacter sp.]